MIHLCLESYCLYFICSAVVFGITSYPDLDLPLGCRCYLTGSSGHCSAPFSEGSFFMWHFFMGLPSFCRQELVFTNRQGTPGLAFCLHERCHDSQLRPTVVHRVLLHGAVSRHLTKAAPVATPTHCPCLWVSPPHFPPGCPVWSPAKTCDLGLVMAPSGYRGQRWEMSPR